MKSLSLAVIASIMFGSGCTSAEQLRGAETVTEPYLEEVIAGEKSGARHLIELKITNKNGSVAAIKAYMKNVGETVYFDACPVVGKYWRHAGTRTDPKGVARPTYREDSVNCASHISLAHEEHEAGVGKIMMVADLVVMTDFVVEASSAGDEIKLPRIKQFTPLLFLLSDGEVEVRGELTASYRAL